MSGKKRVEWTGAQTERLLELYREHECMWNTKLPCFHDRNARHAAMAKLVGELQFSGKHVPLVLYCSGVA